MRYGPIMDRSNVNTRHHCQYGGAWHGIPYEVHYSSTCTIDAIDENRRPRSKLLHVVAFRLSSYLKLLPLPFKVACEMDRETCVSTTARLKRQLTTTRSNTDACHSGTLEIFNSLHLYSTAWIESDSRSEMAKKSIFRCAIATIGP
jgi:hypothetical protein